MEKNQISRKEQFLEHFQNFAANYSKYKNRFAYYWNDITNYYNFFIQDESRVLEIGCGAGDSLAKLKGSHKTGIDFSPNMLEIAKENHPDISFLLMDAENITITDKYDVIILSHVIGYFENIQNVLSSLHPLCHAQTKIFIGYYSRLWEPILKLGENLGIKNKVPQQNWLSRMDIENLLYLSGFETFRTNMRVIFPINIPLLSSFLNKYVAKLPLINNTCLNQFLIARPNPSISLKEVENQYSTTIVIPARNESGNIEDAILRLPKFGKHQEIIFIEGNSSDDTWQKIQEIQNKYKDQYDIKIGQQPGKGKGDAVRKGYSMATGDILMILDADLTMPPEELPKFYNAIATGKGEFINGSRLVYPMEKEAMRFLNTLGNKFFSWVFSWLLEQPIKDSLCGTKVMFRKDYINLIANRSFFGDFDPFGDFDLLFGAYKLNLKIIDLPIRYRERTYGETNISRFTNGMTLLRMCWFAAGKIKFW